MKIITVTQAEFDEIMRLDTDMDSVHVIYDLTKHWRIAGTGAYRSLETHETDGINMAGDFGGDNGDCSAICPTQ